MVLRSQGRGRVEHHWFNLKALSVMLRAFFMPIADSRLIWHNLSPYAFQNPYSNLDFQLVLRQLHAEVRAGAFLC